MSGPAACQYDMLHRIHRRTWLKISALGAFGGALAARQGWSSSVDAGQDSLVIWDNHCHLAGVAGETPEARMAKLIEYADRMHIDRLVLFMGWPFSPDPAPHEMRRQNDQVLEAIGRWPERALAYAYVNPNHGQASLDEMHRLIAGGPMVGIKLWIARRCRDGALDPIVHLATKLHAVVYQHTWLKTSGNLPGESTPVDLAELARRHPEATFICGHAGGNWEHGIRTIRAVKNISLEIAGGDPMAGLVEMAVRELGADRIIYGSDVAGRGFASQLAKVLGAEISLDAKKQILAGNLQRLLGPHRVVGALRDSTRVAEQPGYTPDGSLCDSRPACSP